jgi:hypothetical protein
MSVSNRRRLQYPLGVVALVVGAFAFDAALGVVVDGAVASGFPAWMPTFGSVGETVLAYSMLGNAYAYLLVPAAAFWLGMRYARSDA